MAALVAPVALIVGLALAGGGFDVSTRHIAGLAVWLVVVGLLVLGAAGGATLGRPFYWASGLIVGFAFLSAISSLWSGSSELSVIEADRILVYLAFFIAAFLIAQTDERRKRFAEGMAIGLALIALLSLGSRLLPNVFEVSNLDAGPRQAYPLGYWNANGVAFAIGVSLLLWMSRQAGWAALRWLSVAVMPATLLALYFTYSRGGLLALLVAAGCLLALSRDRLWLLATLAIGAIGALPAVLAVQARNDLADNLPTQATVDQGVTVLLILLAGIALAVGLFALLRRLENRGGQLTGRVLELSRSPVLLKRVALVGALIAIAAAIAVGGRAWDQFTSSDVLPQSQQNEQRFGDLSSAGRSDFWRVAVDAFGEKPVLGNGAGTYEFTWEQHRSIGQVTRDAHSLYLEAFAELGLIGGLTVLALVGALLWFGFSAWRAAAHPQRELYAALLAVMLAFAIGAAIDWFWEIATMGAIFFLAAGVLVAARCAQLKAQGSNGGPPEQRRFGLAVAGLATAWIAAVALVGPLLVDREIEASRNAAADNNITSAIDHAKTARSIEPWAASPYEQLGLIAEELQGDYPVANEMYSEAIEREDRNWELYFLRSRAEREAGNTASAEADLERAKQLNPLAPAIAEAEVELAETLEQSPPAGQSQRSPE